MRGRVCLARTLLPLGPHGVRGPLCLAQALLHSAGRLPSHPPPATSAPPPEHADRQDRTEMGYQRRRRGKDHPYGPKRRFDVVGVLGQMPQLVR